MRRRSFCSTIQARLREVGVRNFFGVELGIWQTRSRTRLLRERGLAIDEDAVGVGVFFWRCWFGPGAAVAGGAASPLEPAWQTAEGQRAAGEASIAAAGNESELAKVGVVMERKGEVRVIGAGFNPRVMVLLGCDGELVERGRDRSAKGTRGARSRRGSFHQASNI